MNFDFSPEQRQFGDQVARMLADLAPVAEARRVLEGDAAYSAPAWQGLAGLGFQAIMIPEEQGGLGMGALEMCIAAEQIGKSLAPVPSLSSAYICAEAIRLYGDAEQQARWLPGLASGSIIGTWAAAEAPGGRATIFKDGTLTGHKLPVLDGMTADIAPESRGPSTIDNCTAANNQIMHGLAPVPRLEWAHPAPRKPLCRYHPAHSSPWQIRIACMAYADKDGALRPHLRVNMAASAMGRTCVLPELGTAFDRSG